MFLESGYSGDTSGRGGGVGEVGGSPEETCALVSGRPQQGWGKGAPPLPSPLHHPHSLSSFFPPAAPPLGEGRQVRNGTWTDTLNSFGFNSLPLCTN